MTLEQFKMLRPGDVVVDLHAQRRKRKIHSITIAKGKPTQNGLTRWCFTVDNLKSSGSVTHIFVSENTGPARFELP